MLELHILLLFMIVGAIVAIEIKDLLSSVIAVGAVGLGLAISFLILKAPDVAITQLVVEILCLIILIRATLKKDLPFATTGRWFLNTTITIIFLLTLLWAAFKCFPQLPEFGSPLFKIAGTYDEISIANDQRIRCQYPGEPQRHYDGQRERLQLLQL